MDTDSCQTCGWTHGSEDINSKTTSLTLDMNRDEKEPTTNGHKKQTNTQRTRQTIAQLNR